MDGIINRTISTKRKGYCSSLLQFLSLLWLVNSQLHQVLESKTKQKVTDNYPITKYNLHISFWFPFENVSQCVTASFDIHLPAPSTPPSEQFVTVSGGGGVGYKHL